MSGPSVSAFNYGGGFSGNTTVVDTVLPEMQHLVDPHWYQFPPLNPLWHGLLGFTIGVLGVVSFCGNGMVLYIFGSTKNLRSPSNLLVMNLALSDYLMMITMAVPMVINCYYETWVLGPLFCEIYGMFGSMFGCGSIWTMVFIAFDRYNVIVKGMSGTPLTNKGSMLRIFFIWAHSAAWTIAPFFGWNRYVPEGNMTACGTDYLNKEWFHRSYILVYALFCYFIPLFGIIYAYFFIVQAVSAHEKSMKEQAKKMNVASLRAEDKAQSAECKLAKIALMTITLWFMAWTPYLVVNFTGIFDGKAITPLATIWASVFAKCSTVYNPIVYGISHPKYRAALYKRFPSLACNASSDDTSSAASGSTQCGDDKASNA
ncbi:rhodopsin-like [Cloeon dipterum]|uniref:rhodopsin-like n=1 Tax=Cloeon dipterum TaxID=197152 RepID=UPI00321FCB9D